MRTYPLRYSAEPLTGPDTVQMQRIEPPQEIWYDRDSGNLVLFDRGKYYTFIDPETVMVAHGFKYTRLDKEPGIRYRLKNMMDKVRANRAERAVM